MMISSYSCRPNAPLMACRGRALPTSPVSGAVACDGSEAVQRLLEPLLGDRGCITVDGNMLRGRRGGGNVELSGADIRSSPEANQLRQSSTTQPTQRLVRNALPSPFSERRLEKLDDAVNPRPDRVCLPRQHLSGRPCSRQGEAPTAQSYGGWQIPRTDSAVA